MLAHHTSLRPAPFLACRGVRLRPHVRPNAFGNALGNSIAQGIASSGSQQAQKVALAGMDHEYGIYGQQDGWARESALQRQEDMRDAEMTRLMGGSGNTSTGIPDGFDFKRASAEANALRAQQALRDVDNYDLMGTPRQVGTAGKEAGRGAWGIAQSLAGSGAKNAEINRIKNQLLALNPELAGGAQPGQRYYVPDANTPENLALAGRADRQYQNLLAARQEATNANEVQRLVNRSAVSQSQGYVAAGAASGVDLIPRGGYAAPAHVPSILDGMPSWVNDGLQNLQALRGVGGVRGLSVLAAKGGSAAVSTAQALYGTAVNLITDVRVLGAGTAYAVNAPTVNNAGLLATEMVLGGNAMAPSPDISPRTRPSGR
jgi:hypothetical protein